MAKRVPMGLSLDGKLMARVDRLAKAMGLTRSRYVENLVRDAIEDAELGVRAFSDPAIMGPLCEMLSKREWVQSCAKAMGAELGEDQLKLFTEAMGNVVLKSKGKGKGKGGKR